jgi:hypothetical protein
MTREAIRAEIRLLEQQLFRTYPTRFRCPYCARRHGHRYGEGRNPDCPHRGDHFEELEAR